MIRSWKQWLLLFITPLMYCSLCHGEMDWVDIQPPISPPHMEGHNMAFDIGNEVAVTFGWYAYNRALPMYTYDGLNWRTVDPQGSWPISRLIILAIRGNGMESSGKRSFRNISLRIDQIFV